MDLVVANDTVQNFVFHNEHNGTFKEIGAVSGIAFDNYGGARGAMGIDAGRFQEDNSLGISIGNFANEMTAFYVSQSDPLTFTDEAIILHVKSAEQTILRQNLQSVSIRRAGHRGRNALIGGAIGAGVGLGAGVAIDRCSPNEIVCTGNKGKAILTPVFGLLGALVGAVIPAGSWQQIYRAS